MSHQTVTQESVIKGTKTGRGAIARICTGTAVVIIALALLSGRSEAAVSTNGLKTINGLNSHNGLFLSNGLKASW